MDGSTARQERHMPRPKAARFWRKLTTATLWRFGRRRPSFMIIGAQKCGTTSLHDYLDQHPRFVGSRPKEVHYFDERILTAPDIAWYEQCFKGPSGAVYFESTPAYLYRPGVAERLHDYNPHLRLIVLLRDPVARAWSAYHHYRATFERGPEARAKLASQQRPAGDQIHARFFEGRSEFPSFRESLEIEWQAMQEGSDTFYDPALIRRGFYLQQLEPFWQRFGRDRVHVVGFRDFVSDPASCLTRIADFVGVSETRWDFVDFTPRKQRRYTQQMDADDRTFLEGIFAPHNEALTQAIGPVDW